MATTSPTASVIFEQKRVILDLALLAGSFACLVNSSSGVGKRGINTVQGLRE